MGTERGLYIERMIRQKMRELRWGYVYNEVLDAHSGIDGSYRSIAARPLGVWLNVQYSFKLYDERKLESFLEKHRQSRGPAAWLFVAFTDNGENTWPLINGYIAAVAGRFGACDPRRRWVHHLTIDENGRADWNDPAGQLRYLRRRHAEGLYNQEARRAGIITKLNGSACIIQQEGVDGSEGRRIAYFTSFENAGRDDLVPGDRVWYLPEAQRISGVRLANYVVRERDAPARFRDTMVAAG